LQKENMTFKVLLIVSSAPAHPTTIQGLCEHIKVAFIPPKLPSAVQLIKINNRIALANRSYFGLVNILKAKNINRKYKVVIYKTLIKPVLMFGAETWVLSKADKLRLGVFERKILRRIYGPICEGAVWRSRCNEELYHLYDETDLVTTVRITRLRWAGHIV